MWIFTPKINKHIFVDNPDFDLIHEIIDCWRNTEDDNQMLIEHNSSWYIVSMSNDDTNLGFNNDFYSYSQSVKKENSDWIIYPSKVNPNTKWKKITGYNDIVKIVFGKYKINVADNTLDPFDIASGSEDLTEYKAHFTRFGENVYKSSTMFGTYAWQGDTVEDDIVVGYRKYTHKELDNNGEQTNIDIEVVQTVQLTEKTPSNWEYYYKGVLYTYSGVLPISNFTMNSDSLTLDMTYIELVSLEKDVVLFDGGTQIVD